MSDGARFAVRFVRLVAVVASHSESRKADGKDGKAIEETVWAGQVGTLQASGKKDQTNDQKRQTTRRKDAAETTEQSVFLLIQACFILIQSKKFKFLTWFLEKTEKKRKKEQKIDLP